MLLRWLLAVLHLTALGIGLGAVWSRARALRRLERGGDLDPVFVADSWWLAALAIWLGTGLVRALAGLERPAGDYAHNDLFWIKMAIFSVIFVIELWPMTAILQWGRWRARGRPFRPAHSRRLARISELQAVLVLVAMALAAGMARGWGAPAR